MVPPEQMALFLRLDPQQRMALWSLMRERQQRRHDRSMAAQGPDVGESSSAQQQQQGRRLLSPAPIVRARQQQQGWDSMQQPLAMRGNRSVQPQQQEGGLRSLARAVRENSLMQQQDGNSTQQQPPAPGAIGPRPAPRRTPSGNIMVWDGTDFVKLPGDLEMDIDIDMDMDVWEDEDEDDII